MPITLNALNPLADINTVVEQVNNSGVNGIAPEYFYDLQLLDTIRLDASHYVYYRLADEMPIQGKADKLTVRRWAPLQAHTVPLEEGVPPKSDKGSFEKYEMGAYQYGRYMEFTDIVNWKIVDPIIAIYTREYSNVVMETFDMLARETLLSIAQVRFAGSKTDITEMNIADCKPTIADLRLIALNLKKALVKPRSSGNYHVIVSVDFTFDMFDDPYVQQYMTINQSTGNFFNGTPQTPGSVLVPMFNLEFYETMAAISTGEFINDAGKKCIMAFKEYDAADDDGQAWIGTRDSLDYVYRVFTEDDAEFSQEAEGAYVNDSRTGLPASFIPDLVTWTFPATASGNEWREFKIDHVLVVGDKALARTGLTGEGQAKMYAKPLGSTGVLDPIEQRQSIGFKINSVGFGSTRLEAVVDYHCVPRQSNL